MHGQRDRVDSTVLDGTQPATNDLDSEVGDLDHSSLFAVRRIREWVVRQSRGGIP